MSACSPKEELEWRSRLADHSGRDILDPGEHALFTSLSLPIKSMGTVFGKPGQFFSRCRLSVPKMRVPRPGDPQLTSHRDHRQKNINSQSNYCGTHVGPLPSHH